MKSSFSATGVLTALLVTAFTVWITARAKSLEEDTGQRADAITATGKQAPDLSLPALDGKTVSLDGYRGKQVVIAYWASWCTPCKAEMPLLNRLYAAARNTPEEFEILAVNVDEERAAAETFAKENGMTYPVLLDPGRKTIDAFHVESVPSTLVVDRTGKIVYGHSGFDQRITFELANKLGVQNFRFGGMDGRRGN